MLSSPRRIQPIMASLGRSSSHILFSASRSRRRYENLCNSNPAASQRDPCSHLVHKGLLFYDACHHVNGAHHRINSMLEKLGLLGSLTRATVFRSKLFFAQLADDQVILIILGQRMAISIQSAPASSRT